MKESPVTLTQNLPKPGELAVSFLLGQMHLLSSDEDVFRKVTQDVILRLEAGERKYGSPLMTHNGRSADLDIYQELCDAIAYFTQKIYETKDAEAVLPLIDDMELLYLVASRCRKRLEKDGIL